MTLAELARADVLRQIDAAVPNSPVVLTLGGTSREMLAVAGRKGNHFISLDAMGQTVSLALGLALGLERKSAGEKVVAIEGDGSLLMGMSALSTVGHLRPTNLVVFVLDNGVYLATGGQPTASCDIDLAAVARACAWADAREVRTAEELASAIQWAMSVKGPILVRVYIGKAQLATDYFLEDPAVLAEDFRRWLRTDRPGAIATEHAGSADEAVL
jgi:thiamine pyrophosphate-dependent acetolactate synthase large subunit-like protein